MKGDSTPDGGADFAAEFIPLKEVANRLGITPGGVRELLSSQAEWLPRPALKAHTWWWRASDLDWGAIAAARRKPGQHRARPAGLTKPSDQGRATSDDATWWT